MTNSPDPEKQPKPSFNHRLRSLLLSRRTGIAIGVPLLFALVGGGWWVWVFIHQQLAPLVERNLTQTLNRPVKVGQLEKFSLNGLRFGASSLPATATDPDTASVEAVDVSFNPLKLLFTRTLLLDVTLINPDVYIQQDQQQRWVSTTIAAGEAEGPIQTVLDTIRLHNADIVLVSSVNNTTKPLPQNTIALSQANGAAEILENGQLIQFNLDGQLKRGGTVALSGDYRPNTEQTSLQVQSQNFLASDLTRLITLPLELQAGRIDSNLKVQLTSDQTETLVYGTAQLQGVTAQAKQLPQPFINSWGTLGFQGTQVRLDNVRSSYGKIPAIASGTLDTKGDYNLSARVKSVSAAAARDTLNLQLPVPASGTFRADVKLNGPIEKPILSGAVASIKPARLDKVGFSQVSTNFTLSTAASQIVFKNAQAIPTVGGKITGNGSIQLALKPGQPTGVKFNAVAQNVPGDALAKVYGINTPNVTIGPVFAKASVSGTSENPRTIVNWQATQGTYPGTGRLVIAKQNVLFRDTVFQVAGGNVRATGQLDIGDRWQAAVQASGINLGRLAQVPPTLETPVSGTLNLSGSAESFAPENIRASGSGRLTGIAGGTVTAQNIQIARGRWQTQLQARGIELRQLAQVPPNIQGRLAGRFNLSGSTTSFQPETIRANGSGRVNVAGGTVTASNIQLAKGQWQGLINASQIQLSQFSQQLRGQLGGQLQAAGTIDAFNLAGITATGRVRLSDELIGQPVTAAFRWNGDNLIVPQVTSPSLKANGIVFVNAKGSGAPEITGVNFNLRVQNYALQNLPLQLPNATNVYGRANFTGRITGNLPTPQVQGSLHLQNLAVNDLAFDPILAGNVQLEPGSGLDLALTGNQNDRITLDLNQNYRPNSFLVQIDQAVATGRTEGENLLVNVEDFPLRVLKINPPNPAFGAGRVAGILSGNVEVNLNTYAASGDLAIAQPAVGRIQGDRLAAQFRYRNGLATLTSSEFIKGESRYALVGSISPTAPGKIPQFQGKATITQGKIQDILSALQFFDFQDLGRGLQPPTYAGVNDVNTVAVGIPQASLQAQLRRYSEIEALLLQQQQQRQNNPQMPALASLTGTFGGEISASGSPKTGITADFKLQGQDWELGSYSANRIIAQGSFEDDVLTLLPLRLESDQMLVAFTGRVGGKQQSGQLRVRDFPISLLQQFVKVPVSFTGNLDATATLAGSRANPQAIGELQLTNGTLNQKPLESATASFSYNNSRLNFGSTVLVAGPEPIQITGSIPYQLPMATVKPDNNLIRLDLNLENEGLAILNLLTDQVAWKGGQGQVQLEVRGTLDQPVASGIATVQDATIAAEALPAPLRDVNGKVLFAGDRIVVDRVQGNFSQGQVAAAGVIPIYASLPPQDPDFENPLKITLDQLELNFQQLYQGDANGNVVISGTALNPIIGGEVRLSQGQVLIPDTAAATPTDSGNPQPTSSGSSNQPKAAPKQLTPTSGNAASNSPIEFNDLRVVLGDDVEVTRQPIVNVQATGTLTVNGNLNDLRPEGTIRLPRGGVNLFTTQFLLDRDYKQTATFKPQQGTDPTLNLHLFARVPEVTQIPVRSAVTSSEISEPLSTDLGALQTVRVEATVQGQASELFDNLELSSTPSRSQSEIIALIGGGFIQTLGSADSALGLANIAGSALLSTYQGTITDIGNTLGLSELRVFPTIITDEESRNSSTLGLAAEAGVDISRNLSVSALGFLTAGQSAQFGFNYRINDALRVRASSDFFDDSRAVLEYEDRF